MDPLASSSQPTSDSTYGSSSKVRVEYTDPPGVFSQIAPELQSRLPLRNLNWRSQSRPLRSIDSLFVELVPDQTSSLSRPTSAAGPSDIVASRPESPAPKRERRHQIPGLRSTPYLKLYFLRCDDSDTYKSSSRKLVREWIKSQSNPTKKGSKAGQENHDACEWLIVHVAPIEGGSLWPSKALTSVLDKLRSDFNSSSKSGAERVMQIPFAGDFQLQGVTAHAIPAGPARDQFIQESDKAWDALLQRFKSLILSSFDQRVRQYEEDIKEKGSQRNIPGWNFCTFFMFKEGLAMGFENVGLLDDALMGYDELSVELLSAIRDQSEKAAAGQATTLFRDSTQDLFEQAEAAWTGNPSSSPRKKNVNKLSTSFLDAEEKPYRELIMANNVSVFDFRCYVFVRQMGVLLRIADSSSVKALHSNDQSAADPATLAEICRRAVSFIASTSRTVRQDLRASFKPTSEEDEERARMRHDITENLVASWTYGTAQQILAQTEDAALAQEISQPQGTGGDQESRRYSSIPAISAPSTSNSQPKHAASRSQTAATLTGAEPLSAEKRPLPTAQSNQRKGALVRLAFQRAELVNLSRKALKSIGERSGWSHRRGGSENSGDPDEMEDVDLNASDTGSKTPAQASPSSKHFIESLPNEALRSAMRSTNAFYKAYEDLSWEAHRLLQYSEDENSVHALLADIAALKFHRKDYSVAASYFHQLAPFYAERQWTELEIAVLDRYALCLKELSRTEDYVRIALKLLGRCTSMPQGHSRLPSSTLPAATQRTLHSHLHQALEVSKSFPEPFKTSLISYFPDFEISSRVTHTPGIDGFSLEISFTHAMVETITAEFIKVRLSGIGEAHGRHIELKSERSLEIKPGKNRVLIVSNALFPGRYFTESITIQAANINFLYHRPPPKPSEAPALSDASEENPEGKCVTVWPRLGSLRIFAAPQTHIQLEKPRSIQLEITTGDLTVDSALIIIRARSAGLRMHVSEARITGNGEITEVSHPGTIHLGAVAAGQTVYINLPYELDTDLKDIQFRTEMKYNTEHGDFIMGDNHTLNVNLPLGVNVQDIFQETALFSKFSITTSTSIPLRILECRVDDTQDFAATTPYQDSDGIPVFSKQPVSMVYRIIRRSEATEGSNLDARLLMHISYRCLDDEILAAVLAQLSVAAERESSVRPYLPLLSNHIHQTLRERLPRLDLANVCLLREAQLSPYGSYGWDRALAAVDPSMQPTLQSWLEKWHSSTPTISLDILPEGAVAAPLRLITLPVDVPPMPVLHTARLNIATFPPEAPPHIGTPISATLSIRHTRAWAQPRPTGETVEKLLNFVYELDAPLDTWLLGGSRRRAFRAKAGEEVQFKIVLIPLRSGRLLLPGLDVRFADEDEEATGKVAPNTDGVDKIDGDEGERMCEVDYMSQGTTVLVVPGIGRVSTGLGFEEGAVDEASGTSPAARGERRMGFGTSWVLATEGYGEPM